VVVLLPPADRVVVGLDVAVEVADAVQVLERLQHLDARADRCADGEVLGLAALNGWKRVEETDAGRSFNALTPTYRAEVVEGVADHRHRHVVRPLLAASGVDLAEVSSALVPVQLVEHHHFHLQQLKEGENG
jgi:hypothetical protein